MTKKSTLPNVFQIDISKAILDYGCLMVFGSVSQVKQFIGSINNQKYINLCLDGTFVEMEDKWYVKNNNTDDDFYYLDDNTIGTRGICIQIRKDSDTNKVIFKLAIDYKRVPERYYEWLDTLYERMYLFSGRLFSLGSDLKLLT